MWTNRQAETTMCKFLRLKRCPARASHAKKVVPLLSEQEKTMIMDMHEVGWPIPKIASSLHKAGSVVFDCIYCDQQK